VQHAQLLARLQSIKQEIETSADEIKLYCYGSEEQVRRPVSSSLFCRAHVVWRICRGGWAAAGRIMSLGAHVVTRHTSGTHTRFWDIVRITSSLQRTERSVVKQRGPTVQPLPMRTREQRTYHPLHRLLYYTPQAYSFFLNSSPRCTLTNHFLLPNGATVMSLQ
jgi:hypothetical protein